MNLPNKLTLLRIVLAFVFMWFLFMHGVVWKVLALVTFLTAALTDFFDGYLAKKYNMTSDFGKMMDPVADKVLTLAAFLAFVEMELIPAWMVVIIVAREMLITGLRMARVVKMNDVLVADRGGKNKTVSQIVSISVILIFVLLKEIGPGKLAFWTPSAEEWGMRIIFFLMLITVAFTISSGVSYIVTNRKYLFPDEKA
jgi:CDP-diacylglycerol--glycerol-3-phosphate 3-phosphatidyltransferase